MKLKWIVFAAIGFLLMITVIVINSNQWFNNIYQVEASPPQIEHKSHNEDTSRIIPNNRNNNENPDNIPTRQAYILLFRFFAKYNNDEAKKYSRGYLRHIGLGKQPKSACLDTTSYTSVGTADEDIDAFIEVANNFNRKVAVFDVKADEIKDRTFPNPKAEAMDELNALQQQKEILTDTTIALLRTKLNLEAFNRIESHILKRIKRLTKKIPSPPNPLSSEWNSPMAHNHN